MNLEYWKNGKIKKYSNLPLTIKATFWFTFCAFLQKAFGILTMPIFTRLMSTKEYGQYSVFVSVSAILTVVMTLNISSIVATKGIHRYKNQADQFLLHIQTLSSISVVFFSIILVSGKKYFYTFFGFDTDILIFMIVQILVIPAFEIWSSKQRYDYRYGKIIGFTVFYLLLNTIIGIGVVTIALDKGKARIISVCAIQIFAYGILYISNIKNKYKFNMEMIKFVLKFNIPLIPQGLSNQILARSDILMIKYFQGVTFSGIYSLGYNIASIIVMLTTSINNVFVPWLYKKMDEKKYKEIRQKTVYMIGSVFLCSSLIILIAPEIVSIAAPDAYRDAIYVVAPVTVGIAFTMIYTLFVNIELYFEKTIAVMLGTCFMALINIILNWYFIPVFGFVAAAYTTLISYIGYSIIHFIFIIKICKNRINIFEIYNIKLLILMSIIQLIILGLIVLLYPFVLYRYSIFLMGIIISIIILKNIKGIITFEEIS